MDYPTRRVPQCEQLARELMCVQVCRSSPMHSKVRKCDGTLPVANGSKGAIRPNLFIIGAMKSGTTYLPEHPSIFICRPKEPYHSVDAGKLRTLRPLGWRQGSWRSQEAYLGLFRSAGAASVIGEASVHYTHLSLASGVPEKIRQLVRLARTR